MSGSNSNEPRDLIHAAAQTTTSSSASSDGRVGHVSGGAFAGYIVIALIAGAACLIFIAWLGRLVYRKRKEKAAAAEDAAEIKSAAGLEEGSEKEGSTKEADDQGSSRVRSASQANTKSSGHGSGAKHESRVSRGSVLRPRDSSTRGLPEDFDGCGASFGKGGDALRGGGFPEEHLAKEAFDATGEAAGYDEDEEDELDGLEPNFSGKPNMHEDGVARKIRRPSPELHYPDGPVRPDESFGPGALENPEGLEEDPEVAESLEHPEGQGDPEGPIDPEDPGGDDEEGDEPQYEGEDVDGQPSTGEAEGDPEDLAHEARKGKRIAEHDPIPENFDGTPGTSQAKSSVELKSLPKAEDPVDKRKAGIPINPQKSPEAGRYSDAISDDSVFADAVGDDSGDVPGRSSADKLLLCCTRSVRSQKLVNAD